MCGIAGIRHLDGSVLDESVLKRFTDSMHHRGPDGGGYQLLDGNCLGLGQRRLSILDLTEQAAQPMSYGNGRYWITYNGEVFNFSEIRETLKAFGFIFHSDSDTEVVLAAYIKWGKRLFGQV